MIEKLTWWLVRHPWAVVLSTILIVAASGYGAKNIKLNADYRAFFSSDNPHLQAFEELQDQYNKVDNILIALVPEDGQVFNTRILTLVEELTEESWQVPYSRRVDSISNFQHTYAEEDDMIVESLFEYSADLSEEEIQAKQAIALKDPVLAGNLIAYDGKATGVNITINLPGINQAKEVPEVVGFVREMVAKYEAAYPEVGFYLTGVTMTNNAFPEASAQDIKELYPVMILLILVLLFFSLKGMWGTLATFSIVVFSSTIAMGLFGWPGPEVTPTTLSAPVMIMTLAIADCIHILMSYYHGIAKGESKPAAMVESIRINFQPVLLTSVTTAIGFLTLNFSDAPPFHDLGNIVCIGVLAAFILAVFFLPALMMLLPSKKVSESFGENKKMQVLSDFVIKNYRALLVGFSVVIIALIALIPMNELDDNTIEYFDWSIKFRSDSETIADTLTGVQSMNYSLKADGEMGVADPEYLKTIDAFAEFLRIQPEVRHVGTFSDVMKRLNKNMNADDEAYYKIPDDRQLAAQYMLLYELSLPYGLDLTNQVNGNKSATRMIVQIDKITAQEIISLDNRAVAWLEENAPQYMVTEGASTAVMFAHITERNIKSMIGGVVGALFLISFIIMLAIKSVKLGFISLIPNLVPAGMAFGLWAVFDGMVGLGLSVVMGVTLGIVVDDTVHFMTKYVRAKRELGLKTEAAIEYAFHTVGVALTATTIVLCAGFMVLALSPFAINTHMGIMSALTIALALIVDFFYLPPLLLKLDKDKTEDAATDIHSSADQVQSPEQKIEVQA
ncbi:efflux RND transporter permease subunit [Bermanella sp. WJH001]|uniref:efflux RND transporter permease subunit n=1 Tax=Bermanella sp. WJH001 TaxID=3048005 RepID=UPI0024BE56C9|nr:MMPL family transporter [Bermanella sp. WJH001]MDJ1537239.1 MMPL family transporter [Bermanella sp. WJH001]